MIKHISLLLTVFLLFSCEKTDFKDQEMDLSYNQVSTASNFNTFHPQNMITSSVNSPAPHLETLCEGIWLQFFLAAKDEACCVWKMEINPMDEYLPRESNIEVYIDGQQLGGGFGLPQKEFNVIVCNEPVLVQIYSNGEFCFGKIFDCETSDCCSHLSFNESCTVEGDCEIYEFRVIDPTGCWRELGGGGFQFNSDLGPPPFQPLSNGFRIQICDPEQRIRNLVWDNRFDETISTTCYVGPWIQLGDCNY